MNIPTGRVLRGKPEMTALPVRSLSDLLTPYHNDTRVAHISDTLHADPAHGLPTGGRVQIAGTIGSFHN